MTDELAREAKIVFVVVDETGAEIEKIEENLDDVGDEAKKATAEVGKLGKKAKATGKAASAAMAKAESRTVRYTSALKRAKAGVGALGEALWPLTAAAAGITAAFAFGDKLAGEALVAQQASAGLQVSITEAADAFGGLVAKVDLATLANSAYKQGVIKDGRDFGNVARGVAAIAKDLGKDQTQLLADITEGLAKQSTELLNNAGIILTKKTAEEKLAASLGKTVGELTAYEKSTAIAQAAMIELTKAGNEQRAEVDGLAASWAQGKISLQDYTQAVLGFDGSLGNLREELRGLPVEVLGELEGSGVQGATRLLTAQRDRFAVAAANLELDAEQNDKVLESLVVEEKILETMRFQAEMQGRTAEVAELELELADNAEAKEVERAAAEAARVQAAENRAKAQGLEVSGFIDLLEKAAGVEGDWSDSHENRIKVGTALRREAASASAQLAAQEAAQEAAAAKAEEAHIIDLLLAESASLDHEAEVGKIRGEKEADLVALQIQSLALRQQAAEAAGDEAKAIELARASEAVQAKFANRKKGKGGRGATAAQKTKAAMESLTQEMADQLRLAELSAEMAGDVAGNELELARARRDLARQDLEIQEAVLTVTRAKGKLERVQNENKAAQLTRAREILDLEAQVEAQRMVTALIREATTLSAQRAEHEARATGRAVERAQMGLDEQASRAKTLAELEEGHARTAIQRLDIRRTRELELSRIARARIAEELRATEADIEAREAALGAESGGSEMELAQRAEEFRQLAHEREVARMSAEMGLRREFEAEKLAQLEAEQDRFEAHIAATEKGFAAFQGFQSSLTQVTDALAAAAKQAAQEELDQTVETLKARGSARGAQYEAELEAAEGNTALQAQIRQRAARDEAAVAKQIEEAERAHGERMEKENLRRAANALFIKGGIATVEAVIDAASFNYLGAALKAGAAASAFAQGALMKAGKIPGPGGAGGGSSSAGASSSAPTPAANDTVDPSSVPGSVPGQAAALEAGTAPTAVNAPRPPVTINGDIIANGAIDDDFAENLARKLDEVAYAREA